MYLKMDIIRAYAINQNNITQMLSMNEFHAKLEYDYY